MLSLPEIRNIVVSIFTQFLAKQPLMHGAALAYYALLALVPVLYLSITYIGGLVGQDVIIGLITELLHDRVGIDDVSGIISFLDNVDVAESSVVLQLVGVLTLMFSCSVIFNSLKKSINIFYGIEKTKIGRKRMIIRSVLSRLISMSFIVGFTVLAVVIYFAETVFLSIGHDFFRDVELVNWVFSSFARHGIPVLTNLIVFSFIFKYLHDGKVVWKMAIIGGVLTSLLLYFGQLALKYYLTNYFFAANGGGAGAMLLILVWVYYSSQIIFLGAEFISVLSKVKGVPIKFRD
ncbi:MAG: YihY/virulence factor BrkB family protein [Crocinitomicaceae bacterium]|nr:YihY/virulence factor BrkB family protein [Crocinitomicaceae bacterium]